MAIALLHVRLVKVADPGFGLHPGRVSPPLLTPIVSNGAQVRRVAALATKRGKSVDFTGYWHIDD